MLIDTFLLHVDLNAELSELQERKLIMLNHAEDIHHVDEPMFATSLSYTDPNNNPTLNHNGRCWCHGILSCILTAHMRRVIGRIITIGLTVKQVSNAASHVCSRQREKVTTTRTRRLSRAQACI